MKYYYADAANNTVGPIDEASLHDLYRDGTITLDSFIIAEGQSDWRTYRSLIPPSAAPSKHSILPPPPRRAIPTHMSIQPTTESLAAWSLVLGIISIAGFTFLTGLLAVLWSPIVIIFIIGCAVVTGLPAVICGHLGRRKIKSNPTLRGPGMALAGLITGYIALSLSFGIIVATNVIGNIEGNKTLHEAELVSSRRYAETFVFVSAAVRARGYTKHWTTKQEAIQELVHGITVKSGGVDYGPFIVTLDERWKDKIEVISQHLRLVDDKLEAVP